MSGASPITLRPLAPGDLGQIEALWVAGWHATMPDIDFTQRLPWFREHMASLMRDDYAVTCAVDAAGQVVGFTAVSESQGHLAQIAVHPDQWGSDAADMLIVAAKERAGQLTLDVNQENPRAVRFYEKHGFRRLRADVNSASGRPTWWYGWP